MHDEEDTLLGFIERTGPDGDCLGMVLEQFAGQGDGRDCLNLSTLHSAKGREFSVVVMFGMDDGIIPRRNAGREQIIEARRLFYVGFTRPKSEVNTMYSEYRPSPFVLEVEERLREEG